MSLLDTLNYNIEPIGHVHSPFKTKFGLPRQAGIIKSTQASIVMEEAYSNEHAFLGLREFSHIWITFVFHQSIANGWKNLVRPPRLGGNQRVGVFASRSPFRPNFIGQSVVVLHSIKIEKQTKLIISCPDLVDKTPIIDIKPYIAYSDQVPNTISGFANTQPESPLNISFSQQAERTLSAYITKYPTLRNLISETLAQDPRPAYKTAQDNKSYALTLYDLDIHFKVSNTNALVTAIKSIN